MKERSATAPAHVNLVIDASAVPPGIVDTGTTVLVRELVQAMALRSHHPQMGMVTSNSDLAGALAPLVRRATSFAGADVVLRPIQPTREREVRALFAGPWHVVLMQLDTIQVDHRSYHPSWIHYRMVREVQRASLLMADKVVTISSDAAASIRRFCPELSDRDVRVVHCGADHVVGRIGRPPATCPERPFWLMLGSAHPHKNRLHALATFAEANRRGFDGSLVLAGAEPRFASSLAAEDRFLLDHPELRARVHRLGPVRDEEKWWLLGHAEAVLYPSTTEGFGLVPFEAAAAGTPCLSAAVSAIPEVCGNEVTFAASFDPREWASLLLEWRATPARAADQVNALLRRRAELTWARAAQNMWLLVDEAIAPRTPRLSPRPRGWWSLDRDPPGLPPARRRAAWAAQQSAYVWRAIGLRMRGQSLGRGYATPAMPSASGPVEKG